MKRIILIPVIFLLILTNLKAQEERLVEISTSMGKMVIKLYNETPKHRDNFIQLAEQEFFDGQLFHRVINNFMIQGGDPNSKNASKGEMLGMGGPGYTVPAELKPGLYHKKGAIAAARKGDAVNPGKESSGSQFYIVHGQVYSGEQLQAFVSGGRHKPFTEQEITDYTTIGGTPHLDDSYTVFGEVIEGMELIDKLAAVPVDSYNRPLEDLVFSVRIIR